MTMKVEKREISEKAKAKNDRIRLINGNTSIIGKFEREEENRERCFICKRKIKNGYIINVRTAEIKDGELIGIYEKNDFLGKFCIKKHRGFLCNFRQIVKKYKKTEKMKIKVTKNLNKEYGKGYVIKYSKYLYKKQIRQCFFSYHFKIHKPNTEHLDYMIESTKKIYNDNDFKNVYKIDDDYYINVNCKQGMYDNMMIGFCYKLWIYRSDDRRRYMFNHDHGVKILPSITKQVSCLI